MRVFVEGVGLLGPGLCGWEAGRSVLAGRAPYVPAPAVLTASPLLPPAERRRCVPTVRLAMAVGAEALGHAARDPVEVATVFTSSSGDPDTLHNILETLASADRGLSPTRFHNSVHNAPAGYWSIATGCREPSTSLCRDDESFQAGLLESVTQVVVDRRVVALISYDLPYPEPLASVRRIVAPLGVALILTPERTERTIAKLEVTLRQGAGEPTRMADAGLEALRTGNPAGRGLPLLAALANEGAASVELDLGPRSRITVEVMPPCR
jgi:hypothetical protein